MDSCYLAAVQGSAGNEKMAAEDPVRRFCLGTLKNIPVQILSIMTVIGQAISLNNHLVTSSPGPTRHWHWFWLLGDGLVVAAFIASFYLREWRLKSVVAKHKDSTGFTKGLPFASLSWLLYAILLGARVALIFKNDLHGEKDIGALKLTICVTAIVCIFFTTGHHHNHEALARRAAILALVKMFTIDLLDTVDVLDVLFETAIEYKETFPVALEDIVLAVVSLNLMRPSMVLMSLFIDHFGSRSRALKVKIFKSLSELLLLNIPLLAIRSFISLSYDDSISVFLVKNLMGIMSGIVEIYDCIYEIRVEGLSKDEKKPSTTDLKGTGGEGKGEVKIEANHNEISF